MKNWEDVFDNMSDDEKDKLAILRVIECSNGVIQHMFRDEDPDALTIEETRDAMKFSMGCMKRMEIPLRSGTVTFSEETKSVMKEIRNLYISGFKKGNGESMKEFIQASRANINSIGKQRILEARQIVYNQVDEFPPIALDWGLSYIFSLVGWFK